LKCDICGKEYPLSSGINNKGRPYTNHRRWHKLKEYENFQKNFREFISQNSRDEKHSRWKGDDAGYIAIHTYVKRRKPKPETCEFCNKKISRLDLANKSGEYKRDINDWYWLCRKCHQDYDGYTQKLHERKIPMDYEKIKKMYLEEKKSTYVIAKELNLPVKLIYANIISPLRKEFQIKLGYCEIKIPYTRRGCVNEVQ
jgi:hypothetical protein